MLKLVLFVVFGIGGGIYALNRQYRNYKAVSAGKNTARQLHEGRIDVATIAEGLEMPVRRKHVDDPQKLAGLRTKIAASIAVGLPKKFIIRRIENGLSNDMLVIADGIVKDIMPTRYGTKEVDKTHACWLYIKVNLAENMVDFTSVFPDDKDHQYLLEDLADHIFTSVIRN